MEKMKELSQKVYDTKYTVSGVKVKQTERNELKSEILDALEIDLSEGFEVVGRSKSGIIVALDNEVEGAMYGVIDIVLKNLDYDPTEDTDDYATLLQERADRLAKRKAKAKK